jgi:threonyl-tRNA synthetase
MRVRNFTQDDAHIFCTPEQVKEESIKFCRLLFGIYHDCGFTDVKIRFADRPEKRAGSDAVWDQAESQLKAAIEAANHPYEMAPGEGAFYGPKLEFHLKDTIGRTWQCGTLQLDFVLPERLDAHYVAEDGQKKRPVMLHRAIFGSMERFIGILIEHYAGHLPLWLAPQQAVVCSIVSDADDYARSVQAELAKAGLRSELDLRNEKINYKVREHSLAKIPLILAVGKRDQEGGTVAVRRLGEEGQKVMPLAEAVEVLKKDARVPGY